MATEMTSPDSLIDDIVRAEADKPPPSMAESSGDIVPAEADTPPPGMRESTGDIVRAEAQTRPLSMREQLRAGVSRNPAMPAPLHQLMKDVVSDPANAAPAPMPRIERRFITLEKAFADIVERHETSLRERLATLSSVEESVVGLRGRMEQFEARHADTMAELRTALGEARLRLNALEASKPAAPELGNAPSRPQPDIESVRVNPADSLLGEISTSRPEDICDVPKESSAGAKPESYLSAARRAANAAASQGDDTKGRRAQAPRRFSRTRLVVLGSAAPLVIVAAAVFALNRHPVTAEPAPQHAALPPPPAAVLSPPPTIETAALADPMPAEIAPGVTLGDLQDMATAGDAKAERDLGLKYLAGDGIAANDEEAARWLLSAAYKGEPVAEYWLGTLYARGKGVPADTFQASHWFEAAANQGNRIAMHSLGVANFQGAGVDQNYAHAAEWFERAAELNFAESQFDLAVLYERGDGVAKSLSAAYKWYAIAASQGNSEAGQRVAELATQLNPSDLADALRDAASFKPAPVDESANATSKPAQSSGG